MTQKCVYQGPILILLWLSLKDILILIELLQGTILCLHPLIFFINMICVRFGLLLILNLSLVVCLNVHVDKDLLKCHRFQTFDLGNIGGLQHLKMIELLISLLKLIGELVSDRIQAQFYMLDSLPIKKFQALFLQSFEFAHFLTAILALTMEELA